MHFSKSRVGVETPELAGKRSEKIQKYCPLNTYIKILNSKIIFLDFFVHKLNVLDFGRVIVGRVAKDVYHFCCVAIPTLRAR